MWYTYAKAETVLARLYKADETVQRGAFRGRLKHLKRCGIPLGMNPGRGKKVMYTEEHVYQWAYCLELEECGLDPTIIGASVAKDWKDVIFPVFKQAERTPTDDNDHYLLIHPQFMSSTWSGEGIISPLSKLKHIRLEAVSREAWRMAGDQSRLWLINVSALVRQIMLTSTFVDSEKHPHS